MRFAQLVAVSAAALFVSVSFAQAQEPVGQAARPPAAQQLPAQPSPGAIERPMMAAPDAATPRAQATEQKTVADYQAWVGKPIESSDGQNVGEIAEIVAGRGDSVQEILADVGGFLGFGQKRVKLMPSQITQRGEKLVVSLTKEEINKLPALKG